ncbi:hypothetical protein H0O02_05305 [Candidatus Micrarchaeota archaeon]|nr:hypothetical protein [Candidatus Micrarchaeota archaeon]
MLDIMSIPAFAGSGLSGGYWSWVALSGAALVTSAVILAFIYAWGTMFRNSSLTSYVKLEIYELVVTALLVMLVLAVAGSLSTFELGKLIPASLIQPSGGGLLVPDECSITSSDTIYKITETYFKCVGNDMESWLNMNYILNMYVDMGASVTPYARPLGIGLISSPLAGLASPLKQLLYNATTALTIAYVINYAQYYSFTFAMEVFILYYLPIGVFLRCFLPTRRLGGTLIAICLGFLVIYPLLTTFAYLLFYNGTGPMVTFRSFMVQYFENGAFLDQLTQYFNPVNYHGFAGFLTGALGGIGDMFQQIFGGIFLVALVFPISVVGRAFVIGYIVPAFNVMILVQAILALSKSFGEEIDVSSLTRMI